MSTETDNKNVERFGEFTHKITTLAYFILLVFMLGAVLKRQQVILEVCSGG